MGNQSAYPVHQLFVGGQPENEVHIILCLHPIHELVAAELAVTAKDYLRSRPSLTYPVDQAAHKAADVGAFVHTAGTEHGQDEPPCRRVEGQHGHVAELTVIVVEKRQLLRPVGVRVRVVQVDDDRMRG